MARQGMFLAGGEPVNLIDPQINCFFEGYAPVPFRVLLVGGYRRSCCCGGKVLGPFPSILESRKTASGHRV